MLDLLSSLERSRRIQINLQSLTQAMVGAGIFAALGSKDTSPSDFLPYPGELNEDSQKPFSVVTQKAIERLMEKGLVPPAAAAAFIELLKR